MFANNFDRIMNERKISNYKMAQTTGLSASLIGYWRKGDRKPSVDNLEIIANYLDVSIDFLVRGNENLGLPQQELPKENLSEIMTQLQQLDDRGRIMVRAAIYRELDRISESNASNISPLPKDKSPMPESTSLLERLPPTLKIRKPANSPSGCNAQLKQAL